jgi:hypothetical protein
MGTRLTSKDTLVDELFWAGSGSEILVKLVLRNVSFSSSSPCPEASISRYVKLTSSMLFSSSAFLPASASPGSPNFVSYIPIGVMPNSKTHP